MTEQEFRSWLDAYGRAWETRDADAAVALFTEDLEYYETPFGTPFRGRDELRDYWARATGSQDGIAFTYEILAVRAGGGLAHWSAEFTRIASGHRSHLDGIALAEFASNGLCRTFREWWHASERAP